MNHYNAFLQQLDRATTAGFTQHFHLSPCGMIRCISSLKEYTIEEVLITVESCVECRTSFYFITAADGTKGTAYEHWDV